MRQHPSLIPETCEKKQKSGRHVRWMLLGSSHFHNIVASRKHQEPRYGNMGEDENHGVRQAKWRIFVPVFLQKPDPMNWNMKVVLAAPRGLSGHHEGIRGLYMRTSGQRVMQHCCQCHSSWRPRRHPNNQRLHKAAAKNHEGCRGTSQRSWPARLTFQMIT